VIGRFGPQTDIENRTGHDPNSAVDAPVLAGTALLLVAGTILSIPWLSD